MKLTSVNKKTFFIIFSISVSPTFIFGTKDDIYFNSTLIFAKYLKELNCNLKLQTLIYGDHGYGLRKEDVAA
ncbi:hypothetical protein [Polaribacter glomeratus]|uniref:Peptidase S9 prolyl oligopeptidase catalytic domain-containing protein n=1 Tax=Polaribacter glomeratus TaxID=102 RepID=A0A2S7WUJ7_9FLAO|nr:hypothetical protein [Polaribacter glomeratus]PQJ81247.1 hypothetical protein BTO16_01015 [Polaribacter glomeratus]TXD65803.1 hypothetical protein ESX12_09280 [Polaribacter glomeratus]